MSENQTAENTGTGEGEEKAFVYPVKIEDAGPGTKKVSVEIPQERIAEKLSEQYKELRRQAAIPGFRVGHAPQKLIEKRFASEIKEQVRRDLISESYGQAVEKNSLQVIGDPQFDNAEEIKLPESGSLTYSFQVEVQPEFTLPELKGVKVRKTTVSITDDNVEEALNNLRQQQGQLVPVETGGVEDKDFLTADVVVKLDGNVLAEEKDAQMVSRPGVVAGIMVNDLDQQLKGLKPGKNVTITAKAPSTYANEAARDKDVQIEITLKDIKRLEMVELNQEFLDSMGFKDVQELRDALREQMKERIDFDIKSSMREQVSKYLLDNVSLELPTKLSDRQEQRVVSRRATNLLMRGMPREQVQANLDKIQAGAKEEAVRELKLFFILQKIATEQSVEVSESELNGRIAMIAIQQGRRPEKLKQEWSKDGTLANLYVQMREQKALDKILESANVEEVEAKADEAKKE